MRGIFYWSIMLRMTLHVVCSPHQPLGVKEVHGRSFWSEKIVIQFVIVSLAHMVSCCKAICSTSTFDPFNLSWVLNRTHSFRSNTDKSDTFKFCSFSYILIKFALENEAYAGTNQWRCLNAVHIFQFSSTSEIEGKLDYWHPKMLLYLCLWQIQPSSKLSNLPSSWIFPLAVREWRVSCWAQ